MDGNIDNVDRNDNGYCTDSTQRVVNKRQQQ